MHERKIYTSERKAGRMNERKEERKEKERYTIKKELKVER